VRHWSTTSARQAAHDAAWALYLLSGGKVGGARRKIAASGELRAWIAEESGCPPGWWKTAMRRSATWPKH
jgi:hypothetical protein